VFLKPDLASLLKLVAGYNYLAAFASHYNFSLGKRYERNASIF
jgi:hypothetical protein